MDETLFLQDEQNFRGTPLPAQWMFLLCVDPHLGQIHSMEFFLVAIYLISLLYGGGLSNDKKRLLDTDSEPEIRTGMVLIFKDKIS